MSWDSFFARDIHKVLKKHSFTYKDYKVSYETNNVKNLDTNNASRMKITPMIDICANVLIENIGNSDAYKTLRLDNVPLMKLPMLTDNGFMIRGTRYACLNEISQADGWYILGDEDQELSKAVDEEIAELTDQLKKDFKKANGADGQSNQKDTEGSSEDDEADTIYEAQNDDTEENNEADEESDTENSDDSFSEDEQSSAIDEERASAMKGTTEKERDDLIRSMGNEISKNYNIHTGISDAKGIKLHYRAPFAANITFMVKYSSKGEPSYVVRGRAVKNEVTWFQFFRAIYPNLSMDEIYEMYKDFDIVTDAYYNELANENQKVKANSSAEDCARVVLSNFFGRSKASQDILRNIDNPLDELYRRFQSISCDTEIRNENIFSFIRLEGLELAKSVKDELSAEDYKYAEPFISNLTVGSTLTKLQLAALDKCKSLKEIYVTRNNKIYRVPKPEVMHHENFIDEIKDMFYAYLLVTEGVGVVQVQDTFENKIVVPIEGKIEEGLEEILNDFKINFIEECSSREVLKSISAAHEKDNMAQFIPCFRAPLEDNYRRFLTKIQKESYFQNKDDTNSMGVYGQQYQVKYGLGKRVPDTLRFVRDDQFGLLCPYSTSEGGNIGTNLYLTLGSVIEHNVVKKKVYRLHNGERVKNENGEYEIVLLHAGQLSRSILALAGQERPEGADLSKVICEESYIGSTKVKLPWSLVEYEEIHQSQNVSPLLACVPNFWSNGGKRGVMSVNTMKQVYPILGGQRSYTDSGVSQEGEVGILTAETLMRSAAIKLGKDPNEFKILPDDTLSIISSEKQYHYTELRYSYSRFAGETFIYEVPALTPTIKLSLRLGKLNIKEDNIYYPNDIVVYMNDIDITRKEVDGEPEMTTKEKISRCGSGVGRCLNVAFLFGNGYNYEDAIIFNESVVGEGNYAIVRLYNIIDEVKISHSKERQRVEYTYKKLDTNSKSLEYIQGDGLPAIGTYLQAGDVVIARAKRECIKQKKTKEISGRMTEDKNRQAKGDKVECPYEEIKKDENHVIFKKPEVESNIILREGKKNKGYVIDTHIGEYKKEDKQTYMRATVTLLVISNIQLGDKFTGGHGNKGVMARILPKHMMPFSQETGEVADVILNPSGVLPRENLGQIIEMVKNAIGKQTGKIQLNEPFNKTDPLKLLDRAESLGLKEVTLVNGLTGRAYDRKAFMAPMYFYRSEHDVQGKFNAEGGNGSIGPNLTPARGQGGGQRYGEQSSWSILAANCVNVHDSLVGIQGTDIEARQKYVRGGCNVDPQHNESMANNLAKVDYRMLGIDFSDYSKGKYRVMTDAHFQECGIEAMPMAKPYDIDDEELFGSAQLMGGSRVAESRTFFYSRKMALNGSFIYPVVLNNVFMLRNLWYISVQLSGKSDLLLAILERINENRPYQDCLELLKPAQLKTLSSTASGSLTKLLKKEYTLVWVKDINLPFLVPVGANSDFVKTKLQGNSFITIGQGYAAVLSVLLGPGFLRNPGDTTMENDDFAKRSLLMSVILNAYKANLALEKHDIDDLKKSNIISYDENEAVKDLIQFISNNSGGDKSATITQYLMHQGFRDISTIRPLLYGMDALKTLNISCPVSYLTFFRENSTKYFFVPPLSYRKDAMDGRVSDKEKLINSLAKIAKTYSPTHAANRILTHYNTIYRSLTAITDMLIPAMTKHQSKNADLRDNVLSVRFSWSGRGYIIVDPTLDMDEMGLPLPTAAGIFASHLTDIHNYDNESVLYKLFTYKFEEAGSVYDSTMEKIGTPQFRKNIVSALAASNVRAFSHRIFGDDITNYKHVLSSCSIDLSEISVTEDIRPYGVVVALFEACKKDLIHALNTLLEIYPVGMERAPSLTQNSNQAFRGKLTLDRYALSLCPLTCKHFNADFDGDQMLAYICVTPEARKEMREKMFPSTHILNEKNGKPTSDINQDMILGIYWATIDKNNVAIALTEKIAKKPEAVYSDLNTIEQHVYTGVIRPQQYVVYKHTFENGVTRFYKDTAGRILLNGIMPNNTGFTRNKFWVAETGEAEINVDNQNLLNLPEYTSIKEMNADLSSGVLEIGSKIAFTNGTGETYQCTAISDSHIDNEIKLRALSSTYECLTCTPYFLDGSKTTVAVNTKNFGKLTDVAMTTGNQGLRDYLNGMKSLGYKMAGESGVTISLFDFRPILQDKTILDKKEALKVEVDKAYKLYELGLKNKDEYTDIMSTRVLDEKTRMASLISHNLDTYNNLYMLIQSGARGKFESLVNLAVMVGMSLDSKGEYILRPSFDNYCSGLSARAYFDTSFAIRRALITSAIYTGQIGEVTRQLVYTLDHVKVTYSKCDAESVDIPMIYEVTLPKEFNCAQFELAKNDNIPNWNALVDEWVLYKSKADIANRPVATDKLLKHLLQVYKCRMICYTSNSKELICKPVKFKMSARSKALIINRTLDLDKLKAKRSNYDFGVKDVFTTRVVTKSEATSMSTAKVHSEYSVVNSKTIKNLESKLAATVPVFLAMNCTCKDGICPRCFGISVTNQAPELNTMYGIRSAQAIGQTASQLALDSHKAGASSTVGSFGIFKNILNQTCLGEKAYLAPYDGVVSLVKDKDKLTMNIISKDSSKDNIAEYNVTNLKVIPENGSFVHKHDLLAFNGTLNYGKMNKQVNLPLRDKVNVVRLNMLNEMLSLFEKEGIYARHFDILLRELVCTGIAEEDAVIDNGNGKSTVYNKGTLYFINDMIKDNVSYAPTMISTLKSLKVNNKTAAAHAMSHLARQVGVDAILQRTCNTASPICGMMRGLSLHELFTVGKPSITEAEIESEYKYRLYGASKYTPDYAIQKLQNAHHVVEAKEVTNEPKYKQAKKSKLRNTNYFSSEAVSFTAPKPIEEIINQPAPKVAEEIIEIGTPKSDVNTSNFFGDNLSKSDDNIIDVEENTSENVSESVVEQESKPEDNGIPNSDAKTTGYFS